MPEKHYSRITEWLDTPPYVLNPKTGVFSPVETSTTVCWPITGAPTPAWPVNHVDKLTSRVLAERKEQVVRIEGGASIKLEWYEFVDREAKSLYWGEVLRREAWKNDSE